MGEEDSRPVPLFRPGKIVAEHATSIWPSKSTYTPGAASYGRRSHKDVGGLSATEKFAESRSRLAFLTNSSPVERPDYTIQSIAEAVLSEVPVATRRHVSAMKSSLLGGDPSLLERMTVGSVIGCWQFLQFIDRVCLLCRPLTILRLTTRIFGRELRSVKFIVTPERRFPHVSGRCDRRDFQRLRIAVEENTLRVLQGSASRPSPVRVPTQSDPR